LTLDRILIWLNVLASDLKIGIRVFDETTLAGRPS